MMKRARARLKTEIWDVWQYRSPGRGARPLWVLSCTDIRDGALYLHGDILTPGDWLVRDPSLTTPIRESNADFERDYEIVSET